MRVLVKNLSVGLLYCSSKWWQYSVDVYSVGTNVYYPININLLSMSGNVQNMWGNSLGLTLNFRRC